MNVLPYIYWLREKESCFLLAFSLFLAAHILIYFLSPRRKKRIILSSQEIHFLQVNIYIIWSISLLLLVIFSLLNGLVISHHIYLSSSDRKKNLVVIIYVRLLIKDTVDEGLKSVTSLLNIRKYIIIQK